jgi:hypothetical protein
LRNRFNKQIDQTALLSAVRTAIASLLNDEERLFAAVFLSYSIADTQVVKAVADGLRKHGISSWLYQEDINPGEKWNMAIQRALSTADFLVFFMSKASMGSHWVQRELDLTIARWLSAQGDVYVIPVLLEDVEIPALLRSVVYIDLRDRDIETGARRIAEAIKFHKKQRT